jgi:hypothetical protein
MVEPDYPSLEIAWIGGVCVQCSCRRAGRPPWSLYRMARDSYYSGLLRKRCRSCAIFRPPTVSVATRTLTSGARRNGRRARDAGRSCTWLPTLEPTLTSRLDGRPCAELAGRLGRTPQPSAHAQAGSGAVAPTGQQWASGRSATKSSFERLVVVYRSGLQASPDLTMHA